MSRRRGGGRQASASLQAAQNAGLVSKGRKRRPISVVMEALGGQEEEEEEDSDFSDFGDAEEVIAEEADQSGDTEKLEKELRGAGMKEDEIENFLLESGFTTVAECNDVEVDDLIECLMEMGVKKLKSKAISRRLKAAAKLAASGGGGGGGAPTSAPAPAPALAPASAATATWLAPLVRHASPFHVCRCCRCR